MWKEERAFFGRKKNKNSNLAINGMGLHQNILGDKNKILLPLLFFLRYWNANTLEFKNPFMGSHHHHQYFRKLLTSILYMRRMPFQYFLKCNETLLLNSTYFSNMDLLSTIFRTCSFFSTLLYDKNHQILNMIPKKQDRKYTKTTFDS